jgi:hypothetical protein
MDAGAGQAFDNSTAVLTATGATVNCQYADTGSDPDYASASAADSGASWNGSWLTQAEMRALADTGLRYRKFKMRIVGDSADSLDAVAFDDYTVDTTPPGVATTRKVSLFETDNHALIWTEPGDGDFDHCELRRDIGGTTKYLTKVADEAAWTESTANPIAFADGCFADADVPFSGHVDEDVSGAPTYYVRSVDATGNASAWSVFESADTGDAPTVPTLTMTDQADGTGATATVSGSDDGTTNTVYTAPYGSSTWTSQGSVAGDGTVDCALDVGLYWARAESDLGGESSFTAPVALNVTGGALPRIAELCNAVVADLASASLSAAFTVSREYLAFFDLDDLDTDIRVIVTPREHSASTVARRRTADEYAVDVGVLRRAETSADADEALHLAEEIQARYLRTELDGAPSPSVERRTLYDPAWMREHRVFATAVTLTFAEAT